MDFNEADLENRLKNLTHEGRIAFGASCCERMLPNYKKFVGIEQWGDYDFFRKTLDKIWKQTYEPKAPQDRLDKLKQQVFDLLPDEEEFESIYVSYALEAGATVRNMLKYCQTRDVKYLLAVVNLLIATVDLFVQEKHDMDSQDPQLEEKIIQDIFMQKELKKQLEDLELLKNQKTFNESYIKVFRSSVEGKSNIEL